MPRKDPKEQAKYFRQWYLKNRQIKLGKNKDWKEENLTPEKQSGYYKKWYDEKGKEYFANLPINVRRAHHTLQNAVRYGKIERQPCGVCREGKVEGHHHQGYEPEHYLDIKWLCSKHHKKEH